jgi:hypothetical protein
MIKDIFTGILAIAFIFLLAWSFGMGINKQERVNCFTWQKEAKEIRPWDGRSGYYLTKNQKEQCDYWGIQVDAVVR